MDNRIKNITTEYRNPLPKIRDSKHCVGCDIRGLERI